MNLFIHRCTFICFSEEQCDYFTTTSPCHFGSFNYSGNPLIDTSSDISIRFKKSNDSEITIIDDNFVEDQNKIGVDYLKRMIYSFTAMGDENQSNCAKRPVQVL